MTPICLQVVNIEHGYKFSYNKKGIEVESLQEMDTLVVFYLSHEVARRPNFIVSFDINL